MSDALDMYEPEARGDAGVFDHEEHALGELTGRSSRRRRQIADWGVGEDAFDRLPGRRFARDDEADRPARAEKTGDTASWLAERESTRRAAAARRSTAAADPTGVRVMPVDERSFTPTAAVAPAPAPTEGRRTIVIGTRHNAELAQQRRRPRPTAAERVGHRPDRIVGWMVAMGFLLILIAILSAGH